MRFFLFGVHLAKLDHGRFGGEDSTKSERKTQVYILDRFLHHAEVITITGKSYRLRHQAGGDNEQKNAKRQKDKDCLPASK